MAQIRKVTIAMMAGTHYIRFNQLFHEDGFYEVFHGRDVRVERLGDRGREFRITTTTNHTQFFVKMQGPDDLPSPRDAEETRTDSYGWYQVEGWPDQIEL